MWLSRQKRRPAGPLNRLAVDVQRPRKPHVIAVQKSQVFTCSDLSTSISCRAGTSIGLPQNLSLSSQRAQIFEGVIAGSVIDDDKLKVIVALGKN